MHADVSVKRSVRQSHESLADGLLRVDTVYHEPDVPGYARAREVLACFPNARRIEVPSHWNIPELHGNQDAVERHAYKQGMKLGPTQADPDLWVYEFGTDSDLSVDAAVRSNVRDIVGHFRGLPNAKATFATKFVNRDLLDYDPQDKTRLRFSLKPPQTSRLVDVRTSAVERRVSAINDFAEAGYEVNVNFGPVIVKDGWQRDYAGHFGMIDASLSPQAKAQLAAEIIFLTHTKELHEVNLRWHPEGEKLLWRPDIQEHKTSQASGERVLRYDRKRWLVREFKELLAERLPYC